MSQSQKMKFNKEGRFVKQANDEDSRMSDKQLLKNLDKNSASAIDKAQPGQLNNGRLNDRGN